MTSQFINTEIQSETGFQAWHFDLPPLGRTSMLLEHGVAELRAVLDSDQLSLVVEFNRGSEQALLMRNWHVAARRDDARRSRLALLLILDLVFARHHSVQRIGVGQRDCGALLPAGMLRDDWIERRVFYQWPELWLDKGCVYPEPACWHVTNAVRHPRRPPQPEQGAFYRRYIPELKQTLSFRVVHPVNDLDLFHDWMNQPRVAPIWELGLPKAELQQYLQQRQADQHIFSVFGCFDDVPFGYFELYWTREDRLGPYYDAGDFDRGLHVLVGDVNFLGTRYFTAWVTGLTHFLFLDDPRTQRVMGEPRADNKALLKHLATIPAFRNLKEFDFPHKRAALLECTRERFFELIPLP
ncbi:MAG: acetyltransferase [Ketobacter sp.]|nr:acetyltransferase [Ketobacter sp.]